MSINELLFVPAKKDTIKDEIINHIHSINKFLPFEYLESLSVDLLMHDVHPVYREYYLEKLRKNEKENKKID